MKGRTVPPRAIITPPDADLRELDLEIQARVCAADRRYFEQHPTATEYTRPFVPGEAPIHGATVLVTRLRPGVRGRALCNEHNLSRMVVIDQDPPAGGVQ